MAFSGQGFIGGVNDVLFGNDARENRDQLLRDSPLGKDFRAFLQGNLDTPVTETEEYRLGREGIRDQVTQAGSQARQRLGEQSTQGGFSDSGSVLRGENDIVRGELNAFAAGVRELIVGLEKNRTEGLLPFLAASAQENVNQRQLDQLLRGQDAQIHDTRFDNIVSAIGGGGGGFG